MKLNLFLHQLAIVLTLASLTLNNITLASSDYKRVVLMATVGALVAIALIGLSWKGMPIAGRAVSIALILANTWTLLDAGLRRLPHVL